MLGGLSPSLIAPSQPTIAKFLQANGYHTACIGKWHLGIDWKKREGKVVSELGIESKEQTQNVDYSQPFEGGPLAAGFDSYFGISASLDMVPYVFLRDRTVTQLPTVEKSFGMRFAEDKNRTRLGPGIDDFKAEDVLPRLTEEAIRYLEERSQKRDQPFFLYLPFASPHTPVAPTKEWLGKSGLNPYADFVMQQDECIGRIMQALEKFDLANDTLVFATSDNGCSNQADLPALRAQGHDPCHPFRGHKADIFEGGHRVPMIVRWPGTIAPGTSSSQTVCLTDLFATMADVLGAQLPPEAAPDSFSWLSIFKNPKAAPVRPYTIHHSINGSFAIRKGDYKLAFCPDSGGWSDPKPANGPNRPTGLQLYHLASDLRETNNLAMTEPQVVLQLARDMEACIANGRSTTGPKLTNDVEVRLWKHATRPDGLAMAPPERTYTEIDALHLREPSWLSAIVHRESSVLLKRSNEELPTARLAFAADRILKVVSTDHTREYIEGRDWKLNASRTELLWVGALPFALITNEQMFPPKDTPNSYRHRTGNPEQNLFYAPGRWFHEHDLEITYHRADFEPVPPIDANPHVRRSMEKLRTKKSLRIGISGDSISTGLDASGTTNTYPNQPGYADLVAAQLRSEFGAEIQLINRSVAGWSITHGSKDLDAMLDANPDLLIVAYGMNDVGRKDPQWFVDQAKEIDKRCKERLPNLEILWVSPMLGNREWVHTPREMFFAYRDLLAKEVAPPGSLVDVTKVWDILLKNKHDLDLTGNGLNHPNDFGHRLYAQAVLDCLR